MPNVATVLKAEIARVSRKEIRTAIEPLKTANLKLKKQISELKKQLAVMEGRLTHLGKGVPASAANNVDESVSKLPRITAKGVRSIRRKLKLSRKDFALLTGASSQSIYKWEGSKGPLKLRGKTLKGLIDARSLSPRKAKKLLEGMAGGDTD